MSENSVRNAFYVLMLVFLVQISLFTYFGALDSIEPLLKYGYIAFIILSLLLVLIQDFLKLDEEEKMKVELIFVKLVILSTIQLFVISIIYKNTFSIGFSVFFFTAFSLGLYLMYKKNNKQATKELPPE